LNQGNNRGKIEETRELPYFLNKKNKEIEGVDSLLNEVEENKIKPKTKRASIYSMLALNPRVERKEDGIIKPPKRNTAFQNIKRILSKTEDEKHELDIKILQFIKVHDMLGELKGILEKEELEKGAKDDVNDKESNEIEEENRIQEEHHEEKIVEEKNKIKKNNMKIEIENPSKPEINKNEENQLNAIQKRKQEIYDKYFKSKNQKIKQNLNFKLKVSSGITSRKTILLEKIKRMKILDLIYDFNKRRKTKIAGIILKNICSQVCKRLQERVLQKLQSLTKLKAHLMKSNWKNNLINNYYKSLDVKSGSLQQNEKAFLSPKYYISSFIETEKQVIKSEKWRYWYQVFNPDISLCSNPNVEPFRESQGGEIINNSTILGAEDGMYDSLIKINSKFQETGLKLENINELVQSEHNSNYENLSESRFNLSFINLKTFKYSEICIYQILL
jgi:hypothetical protein